MEVQQDYGPRGLRIVGITAASREETERFITEHGIDYPVLAEARECQRSFGVDAIWGNVVFLVDPSGTIVADEEEEAERRIAAELRDRPPP